MTKIFSTKKLEGLAAEILKDWQVEYQDPQGAQVLMATPVEVRELVPRMPSLEIIQTFSAGVDGLPFELIPFKVKLFSNAGAFSLPVAEHAWALVLALAKNINLKNRTESYILTKKTLLVLGGGGIGTKVARIGKAAFGMKTVGVSRSFQEPDAFDERWTVERLAEIIQEADICVLALPLTKHTKGMFNYSLLTKMKEKSILVNVGRAEVVVEHDLAKLLAERPSFRFGTDVFWRRNGLEKFDIELWSYPNFMGTPHTAGADSNPEVLSQAIVRAADNVRLILTTGRGQNEVRRDDYI